MSLIVVAVAAVDVARSKDMAVTIMDACCANEIKYVGQRASF